MKSAKPALHAGRPLLRLDGEDSVAAAAVLTKKTRKQRSNQSRTAIYGRLYAALCIRNLTIVGPPSEAGRSFPALATSCSVTSVLNPHSLYRRSRATLQARK